MVPLLSIHPNPNSLSRRGGKNNATIDGRRRYEIQNFLGICRGDGRVARTVFGRPLHFCDRLQHVGRLLITASIGLTCSGVSLGTGEESAGSSAVCTLTLKSRSPDSCFREIRLQTHPGCARGLVSESVGDLDLNQDVLPSIGVRVLRQEERTFQC